MNCGSLYISNIASSSWVSAGYIESVEQQGALW